MCISKRTVNAQVGMQWSHSLEQADEQTYLPARVYKTEISVCAAIIMLEAMTNLP